MMASCLSSPSAQESQGHNAGCSCAIYFGLSCALAAFHGQTSRRKTRGLDVMDQCQWPRVSELMLQGSVQLLGLLLAASKSKSRGREEVAKLEVEVEELRRRRAEDAKANEKVVGIFAAHEQRWLAERKSLQRQLQALVAEMRLLKSRHEESLSELRRQLEEEQSAVGFKDEALEQEMKRGNELEEKLRRAQELSDKANKEAQDHRAELWKHKTAFLELVSNQRQLEAELARALRHAEEAKQELDEALERRDEATAMVEELSVEIARMQKDAEHKDKILSAMLRKSKIDMEDKERLVKEVKICKAKRKQAELETERWRKMWESRQHRKPSRSSRYTDVPDAALHCPKIVFVDRVEGRSRKDQQVPMPTEDTTVSALDCVDRYPSHVIHKPAGDDYHCMQEWVQMETDKNASMVEHRHSAEIEAFSEQLRLKDEKLDAFRWQLASMDLEATRLGHRIEELERSLSHYREQNTKLEALLFEEEKEKRSLKEQLSFHANQRQKINSEIHPAQDARSSQIPWPRFKMSSGRKSREGDPESEDKLASCDIRMSEEDVPNNGNAAHDEQKGKEDVMRYDNGASEVEATNSSRASVPAENLGDHAEETSPEVPEVAAENASEDPVATSVKEEIEEDKEVGMMDSGNAHLPIISSPGEGTDTADKLAADGQKNSSWKMDIHSLAVSYKIKRLKQQLLVLEKLATAKASGKSDDTDSRRSYRLMMSFLSKQVKRYQSLEEKIDDLCRRMEESNRRGGLREQQNGRSKEQSEALGHFLEETFQLQRYMVATGQKLLEIQSKIASSSMAIGADITDGVDVHRFMEVVRSLFRDIQRGLEVRIVRIIGDVGGTLACDGILQSSN